VTFEAMPISRNDFVGPTGFYLSRPGFWHGACAPAACWAGGAAGLVDWAAKQKRSDSHTLAHFGAMRSSLWIMEMLLHAAGAEIDSSPSNQQAAHLRALQVRHLLEVHATDILRRLARAYGHPDRVRRETAEGKGPIPDSALKRLRSEQRWEGHLLPFQRAKCFHWL
jgi:hypothetical protein